MHFLAAPWPRPAAVAVSAAIINTDKMDPNTDCLCTSSQGSQCIQKGILVGSGKGTLQKMQATCIPAKFPGARDPASAPPEDSAMLTVVRETITNEHRHKHRHGSYSKVTE